MHSVLSLAERDRRWEGLDAAMESEGLEALVAVSSAYNGGGGHKGALRYIADHHLLGFHAYAVKRPGQEATVVMPAGMEGRERSSWVADYRFGRSTAQTLVDVLSELNSPQRIGIVGLKQTMRVDEYQVVTEAFPGTEFIDATHVLDRVRCVKSPEEVLGLEEAAYICDQCLKHLIEVARPGLSKRSLMAEMYKSCAELGGEDPIFLIMEGFARAGEAQVAWSRHDDSVLSPSDLFMFSFECIGPSGYWVELCRMITFAPPSDDKRAIHGAIVEAMKAARLALRPGVTAEDVQSAIVAVADNTDTRLAWWSGHSIGQDVMEAPAVGREVMQDVTPGAAPGPPVAESMAFAIHPLLVPKRDGVAGYLADTYVVGPDETRQLSAFSSDLLEVV